MLYKEKRRGEKLFINLRPSIRRSIFHRQSIVILPEQIFMDKFQTEYLITLVVIAFGAEVFITVA